MSKQDTGGPAFPYANDDYDGNWDKSKMIPGMTLRDYFAANAPEPNSDWMATMQGMERGRNPYNEDHKPPLRSKVQLIAAFKYEYADAMLAERAK